MDKATLHKIYNICNQNISTVVVASYRENGKISGETKNRIEEYVSTIKTIEEILDNLQEDENYYD